MQRVMDSIFVVLYGVGGVGSEVVRILNSRRESLQEHDLPDISFVGLVDSTAAVYCKNGLSSETVERLLKHKKSKKPFKTFKCSLETEGKLTNEDIRSVIGGSVSHNVLYRVHDDKRSFVLVDCTSDDAVSEDLVTALRIWKNWSVVLANKKPLTKSIKTFQLLTADPKRIRYESTVGAGLPVVATLRRVILSADPIFKITGAFSGTLGFLCSQLESKADATFSNVVLKAKAMGYTEPDPREDLNGMDVARKALILARTCGSLVAMEDVKVQSLFPSWMQTMDVHDFLKEMSELDGKFKSKFSAAEEQNKTLRYCATIIFSHDRRAKVEVGLKEVSKSSALGRLQGSDNIVSVESFVYSDSPLVLQGAGAGATSTATGVIGDIFDMHLR